MKIAIDYRLATSSNRGMARYCREIVSELFSLDTENDYYLLSNVIPKDISLPQNFTFVRLKVSNFIFTEQFSIPLKCKKLKIDILWSPYNTFPVFLSKKIRLIVTIHDLIFMHSPAFKENIYKRIGRLYRKFVLKKFSAHIDTYFTVSKYSDDVIQHLLKLKNLGGITSNCLSKNFIFCAKKYNGLSKEDFYFTVSGDSPSKNLMFLIMIFKENLPDETLYVAGLDEKSDFRKYQSEKIIFLPHLISDEELVKLYSTCKGFIFPSLEEGFGIPIIEALCCHAKVISSDRTCLPEILNNQGLLFNPENPNSLLEAIKKADKHKFSYDISKYISWKKSAEIVLNEFKKQELSK